MGLLDNWNEFIQTPEGQGLLSAVFGGLATAQRGQPFNSLGRAGVAGLTGFNNALNRQDTLKQQADLQAERLNMQKVRDMQMKASELQYNTTLDQLNRDKLAREADTKALSPFPAFYSLTPSGRSVAGQDMSLGSDYGAARPKTVEEVEQARIESGIPSIYDKGIAERLKRLTSESLIDKRNKAGGFTASGRPIEKFIEDPSNPMNAILHRMNPDTLEYEPVLVNGEPVVQPKRYDVMSNSATLPPETRNAGTQLARDRAIATQKSQYLGEDLQNGGVKVWNPVSKTISTVDSSLPGPKSVERETTENENTNTMYRMVYDGANKILDRVQKNPAILDNIGPVAGRWATIRAKYLDGGDAAFNELKPQIGFFLNELYGTTGKVFTEAEMKMWLNTLMIPTENLTPQAFVSSITTARDRVAERIQKGREASKSQRRLPLPGVGAESSGGGLSPEAEALKKRMMVK